MAFVNAGGREYYSGAKKLVATDAHGVTNCTNIGRVKGILTMTNDITVHFGVTNVAGPPDIAVGAEHVKLSPGPGQILPFAPSGVTFSGDVYALF